MTQTPQDGRTRGQWPYRPASKERAMTNRPMILYDFNILWINLKVKEKIFCVPPRFDQNLPNPLALHLAPETGPQVAAGGAQKRARKIPPHV